ncbi:pseudouridylate synthase [uncultured Arcticibacterium sp.]|uniref:pseudouridylate synthase n=1 Tax=uncultured Arcticibacterium sp. TaxID=2173042 RepID=UPI0030FC13C9
MKKEKHFNLLNTPHNISELPERFTYPFDYDVHPVCQLAVEELQNYLATQKDWIHNFGLDPEMKGPIIGKMFGVMVVKNINGELGYLAAFSGKLAGGNIHTRFVPPVFDALEEGSFLNIGMAELTQMGEKIKSLKGIAREEEIDKLKEIRKSHSQSLQNTLFDHYNFLNTHGVQKNIREIFSHNLNSNPPAGAGECATPKLLQYAFQNQMKPIAMAEFWWGQSPKSDQWKHGEFYPACDEKCRPILGHMLDGILIEDEPR